jgi:hypothetical protein
MELDMELDTELEINVVIVYVCMYILYIQSAWTEGKTGRHTSGLGPHRAYTCRRRWSAWWRRDSVLVNARQSRFRVVVGCPLCALSHRNFWVEAAEENGGVIVDSGMMQRDLAEL